MSVECLVSTTLLLGAAFTSCPALRATTGNTAGPSNRPISVYRQVKCPYGVAGKASALCAGKREQVECPYGVAGKASALGAGNDIPKSAYCLVSSSSERETESRPRVRGGTKVLPWPPWERVASACMRRHQVFALVPVKESCFRVYEEAPGFCPGPGSTSAPLSGFK